MSADYRLGDCVVRPARRLVERNGSRFKLSPRSAAVLEALRAAGSEPVSRSELFEQVWQGAEVSDDALTRCVVELRKAFGDTARDSQVIETIPKLGFRLVPPAQPLAAAHAASAPADRGSAHLSGPGRRRRAWLLVPATVLLAAGILLVVNADRGGLQERYSTPEPGAAAGVTTVPVAEAVARPADGIAAAPPPSSDPPPAPDGVTSPPPGTAERRPGIAVLPFQNLSGRDEDQYFADGMAVEIINLLAAADRIPVTARNSSFQFKGQNRDVREIGRLLGVTYILEGSVRWFREDIRLTVQLIDTTTGSHLWSGAYQRELSDLFAVQADVARDIVAQVSAALGEATPAAAAGLAARRRTDSPRAYDSYLRGMQLLRSNNPKEIEAAGAFFDRAIELDPDYADAWAARGYFFYALGRPGFGHLQIPATVYPDAIAALRRALEIEPGHAGARGWLGAALIANDYRWAEGLDLIRQSLASNPNDAELLSVYGLLLEFMHFEGAEEVMYRAFRLDPLGYVPTVIRATGLRRAGRSYDAAALIETYLARNPDGYAPNYMAAGFYLLQGRLDAAEQSLGRARRKAHAGDLSLDAMQWMLDYLRDGTPLPPLAETVERMRSQRLSNLFIARQLVEWDDPQAIVAAYELGIEQRLPEMRNQLFQPKPPLMPASEWERLRDITGVTDFLQAPHRAALPTDGSADQLP